MSFDYTRLDGRITEKFGTRRAFAEAMGTSEHTVSVKMKGKVGWTQREMDRVCDLLQIPHADIPSYFFVRKVQSD